MRPRLRFTVRSLMKMVVAVALICSLVAYQRRLYRRAAYHQDQYWKKVLMGPATNDAVLRISKLPDGSWSPPHQSTPEADWHIRRRNHYDDVANRINQCILTGLLMAIFLTVLRKAGALYRRRR